MAWVRLDDTVPRHHKFLEAGPAACWLYVCGLCHCQSLSTDGFISAAALPLLGIAKGYLPLAAKLVAVHLWEHVAGGYQVHDYLEHNRTRDEADAHEAARRETKRLAGIASGRARRLAREQREQPVEQTEEQDANTGVRDPANSAVEHMLNPDPTRPDPSVEQQTVQQPDTRARAGLGPHARHAWCSERGKCVQAFLHEEFMKAVGGDRRAADLSLRAFYTATEHAWPGGPIGDDPLVLWRREFADAFPSVAPRLRSAREEAPIRSRLTPFQQAKALGLK